MFRPARRRALHRSNGLGEGSFRVSGAGIERLVARYDLDNDDALAHLERRLRGIGVIRALEAKGFEPGDDVEIAGVAFDLDPERVAIAIAPDAEHGERSLPLRRSVLARCRSTASTLVCAPVGACPRFCASARTTGSRASSRRSRRRSTPPSRATGS